jgi:hypothetical protein
MNYLVAVDLKLTGTMTFHIYCLAIILKVIMCIIDKVWIEKISNCMFDIVRSILPNNSESLSYVNPRMMWLLKLIFDQNSIMISYKSNGDFNSHIILKWT